MHRIAIKPLSTNEAWKGRRFKTPEYKTFDRVLTALLPRGIKIPDGDLMITFVFGLSNGGADYDNCIKQAQDVIARKYGFNDSRITHAVIHKVRTEKGCEYIRFRIEAANPFLEIPLLGEARA